MSGVIIDTLFYIAIIGTIITAIISFKKMIKCKKEYQDDSMIFLKYW